MERFDLVVIGAGAGGLNSAFTAAQRGKKVALIEQAKPGGECTWTGCIPSKALIQIAKDVRVAQKFAAVTPDTAKVMEKVRALIERAHQSEAVPVLEEAGIAFIQGTALFKQAKVLSVGDRELQAENVVIATGSRAAVPDIPGLATVPYLTNENFFHLEKLPSSVIVLGAGAIGVELSQAMQRLGVKVTLIDQAEHILPREEAEFGSAVQEILSAEGVTVHVCCVADSVRQDSDGISVLTRCNGNLSELKAEAIFVALGRRPNVHTLNLADVGIRFDAGGIVVDEYCETSVKRVYAVGDVVGPYLFSHTAGHQARSLIRNLYGASQQPIKLDNHAWSTFCEPEMARCGLTEEQARKTHGDNVRVYNASYADLDRAVVDQKTTGMAKIICDDRGKILGASILGERACELLCEIQVLKQHDIALQALQEAIHPYPGYSELLLGLSLEAYGDLEH